MKRHVNGTRVLALLALSQLSVAHSADIDWKGWSLDYSTNNNSSGLVLSDVKYAGRDVLAKASMPVMRVEYNNDICGPYADILNSRALRNATSGAPDSACDNQAVCKRTFTRDGEEMLEIGSNWQIGEYQIYQTYYFSENGYFDSRVYSRGLQCEVNHAHHAHWMFDFDIDGGDNDQVMRESGSVENTEFNDLRSNTDYWTVQDSVSGQQVRVVPASDDGDADDFSEWDVAVRAYNSIETGRWAHGARGEIGEKYNDGQSINDTDIMLWYVSHLPHSASEGSGLWHSSGPRIEVMSDTQPPPEPEPEPVPTPIGDNLLSNGGFEAGDAGWFDCGNDVNTAITSGTVNTGSNAMLVSDGGCLYQEADATAGENYLLSCQAERSGSNWTILEFSYMDAEYNVLDSDIRQITNGGGFREYQFGGTAPSETAYAAVLLYSEDETVLDSCVLEKTDELPPVTEPEPSGQNLLSNGSFESELDGWNSCASANLTSISREAQSGTFALSITDGGCLYQEFPITVGSRYAMSCQARNTGDQYSSVTLALLDESYSSLQTTELPVTSADFTAQDATLDAPEGSLYGTVVMYSEAPGYFDDCSVVKVAN